MLSACVLAAIGGCWWPIEVTPDWVQTLQKLVPPGWTMDAMHNPISFEAGAASAIPHVIVLFVAAWVVGRVAARGGITRHNPRIALSVTQTGSHD